MPCQNFLRLLGYRVMNKQEMGRTGYTRNEALQVEVEEYQVLAHEMLAEVKRLDKEVRTLRRLYKTLQVRRDNNAI